jgi:16S rRNA (uracil1498-N3)-methyltransferase
LNLFYQPRITDGVFSLDPEESRHCVKVLRKNTGDTIRITDGKGSFYDATITAAHANQCEFHIDETISVSQPPWYIHIAIAPTKNADRIEWFVEKSVELGIQAITLIECKNSERTYQKTERLTKVAVSAMKQSLKAWLPAIHPLTKVSSLISSSTENQRFIAYVDQSNPAHLHSLATKHTSYLVLIGPEGDFSTYELTMAQNNGFIKVSLGQSRLRTETAGMAACHILNLINN